MERAARYEADVGLHREVAEFRMPNDAAAYEAASRPSVFGSFPRTFILWNCPTVPDLLGDDEDVVVVVAPPGKKKIEDGRAVRSHFFPKMKTFGDNNEVMRWILREGERLNTDLSRVAGALFVNSGSRLRKLASEIEKVSLVSSKGSAATPDDARSVLCFSAELTPKEIVESISSGNAGMALSYYDKLQEQGDETGWIIAYVHRHVLNVLRARVMHDAGRSESDIAVALGVHPFVVKKSIVPIVGTWTLESLRKSCSALATADVLHKSGVQRARVILESEILRLSTEVRKA